MSTSPDRRRELRDAYRLRTTEAGVYMLRNTITKKILIASSRDLGSLRNRLDFGRSTGSTGVLDPRMASDARAHGMGSFELVVLDLIEVREGETSAEIAADLAALEVLWREKLRNAPQY